MGASSASELGARFPDIPSALILEDPPWGKRRPDRDQQEGQSGSSVLDWAKSLKGKSLDEVLAENVHEHPSWESAVLRAWCIGKTQLDQKFLSLQSLTWMDWQEVVQGIECPTLLITANQPGGIVSEETANLALSMNERVMRVHISGTGHHIRFENYDDYYAAFIAFLDKVSNIERS